MRKDTPVWIFICLLWSMLAVAVDRKTHELKTPSVVPVENSQTIATKKDCKGARNCCDLSVSVEGGIWCERFIREKK